MSPQAKTLDVRYTYEDYLLFPEDGRRHEIIEGEHYITPSSKTNHQSTSLNLSLALGLFVKQRKLGKIFVAPYDVILSDENVVQPDILFISASRADVITQKHVRGAPDLIVEILSEKTRKIDEIIKRKLYEQFGVYEYWVVDPELECVKVYRRTDGGYDRIAELTREAGDSLTTPLLEDLDIPLADIFESP